MDLRPAEAARTEETLEALMATTEARAVPSRHAGFLEGATATGEAARRHLSVRIGVWLDDRGSVRQARWRAARDVGLRACAEAGCALLESGADPARVDADALRNVASAAGAECAELVAAAIEAATMPSAGR